MGSTVLVDGNEYLRFAARMLIRWNLDAVWEWWRIKLTNMRVYANDSFFCILYVYSILGLNVLVW